MSRYQTCGITNCFYNTIPGSSFCAEHQPAKMLQLEKEDKPAIDMVNSPPHYNKGKFEVIDMLEDVLGKEGFEKYCIGNSLKYLMRYEHKENPLQDLEKAAWYLNKAIEKRKAAK